LVEFAPRFAAAGIATFVFDCRHFGDSDGEPRHLLSIRRQLADWRAAIASVRMVDVVDAGRIALWGTSFSGGHVLTIAAHNRGILAVVAQSPHVGRCSGLPTPPGQYLKLTAAGLRDG